MAKIFLAQMQPVLGDKNTNLNKMFAFIKQGAERKADLVLFPEMALTGYFTRERTQALAEELNGPSIVQLQKWAEVYKVKVIFGFPEKIGETVYNSACFINHDGEVFGSYQKIHLWDEEYKYFAAGENFKVWDTDIGKIGIMICFDTEFPETARLLALKGAEILLAPTANMTPYAERQKVQIQCRAGENQIFVASTNRVGTEESTHFFGESAAADPFGDLLIMGNQEESGYLVECDLDKIKKSTSDFDYLKSRRPALYSDMM